MSLNNTPSAERLHIGIFGKRNAGKSSVINALTGQNLAIVSDIKGTTTDPVLKSMELLPLGPVVIIDTPGLDDDADILGELRIQKAYQMLNKTDIAILVIDGTVGMTEEDKKILTHIQDKKIPYIVVLNKADLAVSKICPGNQSDSDVCKTPDSIKAETGVTEKNLDSIKADIVESCQIPSEHILWVSAQNHSNIQELKELIGKLIPSSDNDRYIVRDLIRPMDLIVLVVPIDSAAPKGRLILPQQQTIRDILESGAVSIVVRETELADTLKKLGRDPDLVITDSQAFKQVSAIVPEHVPLTSFSILFARYKGNLKTVVHGAYTLDKLKKGDKILISEGCTHHRQCGDIGTVKLPNLIRRYTGKDFEFEFTSGTEFPLNLSEYQLIIHCGGCMLNEREMKYRLKCAEDAHIPMTNYGTAIAYMNGILNRSISIFRDTLDLKEI